MLGGIQSSAPVKYCGPMSEIPELPLGPLVRCERHRIAVPLVGSPSSQHKEELRADVLHCDQIYTAPCSRVGGIRRPSIPMQALNAIKPCSAPIHAIVAIICECASSSSCSMRSYTGQAIRPISSIAVVQPISHIAVVQPFNLAALNRLTFFVLPSCSSIRGPSLSSSSSSRLNPPCCLIRSLRRR